MGKPKYKKFFPQSSCLANEIYSLLDICFKVNQTIREKIYCVKCGENQQDAIFSCGDHMPMVIFCC